MKRPDLREYRFRCELTYEIQTKGWFGRTKVQTVKEHRFYAISARTLTNATSKVIQFLRMVGARQSAKAMTDGSISFLEENRKYREFNNILGFSVLDYKILKVNELSPWKERTVKEAREKLTVQEYEEVINDIKEETK